MKPTDLVITKWGARYRGQHFPCAIGRGGIGQKQGEGDGVTPIGVFNLCLIGVRPDRMDLTSAVSQRPIGPNDIWSDDPSDPGYNTWQTGRFAKHSHEVLRRADPLYDMFGVLDFNWPRPVSEAGSAIFLHAWRKPRHPTEGCVAFSPIFLGFIFSTWVPNSKVIIR